MPQPFDYFNAMGGAENIGGVNEAVTSRLLGQQQVQSNQNVLDQQTRADAARKAAAKIATTPNLDDNTYEALLQPIAAADPNTAVALRRQRAMQRDQADLIRNPTAEAIGRFGMTYPEALEPIKKGFEVMDGARREAANKFLTSVYSYLGNNAPDSAAALVQSHIDAGTKAGQDVSDEQQLLAAIKANPAAARATAGLLLSQSLGGEKFAEAFSKLGSERRDDEKQPFAVQQAAADASIKTTEAQYKPQVIQSDLASEKAARDRQYAQTANEQADLAIKRDGLALERDKLTSSIQLKLEELDRTGTQLTDSARGVVNTAVGNSASASALADRMDNLADRIKGAHIGMTGWMGTAREAWKGAFGGQDPISGLRAEYNQIVNAQAVKNLPPGPASDKDIALAKQGFPPANASPDYLDKFLRGMAKMQGAVAAAEDRKANWVAANGSLAPIRRDTSIGGVLVPAGTTFTEFNGNAIKRSKQGDLPPAILGIVDRYGKRR